MEKGWYDSVRYSELTSRIHRAKFGFAWAIPAAACLLLLGELGLSIRQLSQTADESTHLYAGYRYWKCGDFGFGPEHPPLARLIAAAPLLGAGADAACRASIRDENLAALAWLYGHDGKAMLVRARTAVSIFALGLCVLVWVAARRMFDFPAAVAATVLLIFEPNVLAHGALVTTDMAVSLMLPATVFAFYLWVQKRTLLYLLLTGVAAGLTLVAKHSGAEVLPILVLLALADAYRSAKEWRGRWRMAWQNGLAVVVVSLLAAGIVWGVYGFRFSARPDGTPLPAPRVGEGSTLMLAMEQRRLLPEAYLTGLQTAWALANAPQPMFLLGQVHSGARWYFFPVNLAVRCTAGTLLLLLAALLGARSVFREHSRELLFLALPALFFLSVCACARMPSGIRHLLPVMFFLLLFAAAGCADWARRVAWFKYLIAGALLWHGASSLHAFPNYLSYANELWGGPSHAYTLVPGVDWGQSFPQITKYVEQRGSPPCWFATIYQVDLRPYNVPCRQFWRVLDEPVPPRVHGIMVLSSAFLNRRPEDWPTIFVAQHAPRALLGGSALLVYEGDFDTRAATGISAAYQARRSMTQGRFAQALQYAQQAVAAAPGESWPRFEYCRALIATGALDLAVTECALARIVFYESRDPSSRPSFGPEAVTGIREALTARRLLNQGRAPEALEHARRAAALAPSSGDAHFEYCRALTAAKETEAAVGECSTARILQRGMPLFNRGWLFPGPEGAGMIDIMTYAAGASP
jgi:4-amino-4-deoxy-L-arabinose transferase-like glycosyltransferase